MHEEDKWIFTYYYTFDGGGLAAFFTSCQNFLDGKEIKDEIENQIAYANAQSYTIRVEAQAGSGVVKSPAGGSVSKKVTDTFTVGFDPLTDFAFIRWKIMDAASETEIPNGAYINIASLTDSETQCTFQNPPEDGMELVLVPVLAERPQIISNFPSTSGMLKDSVIQVLFDSDMDPFSIYYTEDELKQMKNSGVTDEDFLPRIDETNPIDSNNHYGYKDASGEIFFKNITMTNKKTKQNLTGCFGAPVFENASTLSIPVNDKNALPGYTQVLVTIGRGFFYRKDEKIVAMAGSKKWMYQVNDKTDTKPLIVSKTGSADDFTAKTSESDVTAISQETSHTVSTSGGGSGINTLNFIKENKLYLDLHVQEPETGSGPKSYFTLILKKIYGKNYVPVAEDEKTALIDFQNVTADDAVIDGYVDLAGLYDADDGEELTLEDGVYAMSFMFEDNSGNQFTYPTDGKKYYFAKDTTPPDIAMPTVSSSNSTTYKLEWNDSFDLDTSEIIYGIENSAMTTESFAKGTKSGNITGIASGNKYVVKVKFKDYAGNEIEKTVPPFMTGLEVTGVPSSDALLKSDRANRYGLTVTATYYDGSSKTVSDSAVVASSTRGLTAGNVLFSFEEGNISKTCTLSGSYYIAASDALTQVPSFYQDSSDGWWYCKFGDYPQNVSTISSYTTNPVYNGWFMGSDGYFYELCTSWVATQKDNGNKMSNGQSMANNTPYYFKVQPIEWRYASGDYNGKRLLIAKRNLDRSVYYTSTSTRSVNGNTVNPNDYKYSTLRAFLNGKYESGDPQSKTYQGKGFLQRAFTSSAQALIFEGNVDNSARSTNTQKNAKQWSNGNNVFAYGSTKDKVFVLSVQEATNESYGFNKDPTWKEFGMRLVRTTDYAKAKHVFQSQWKDGKYESNWWLRSPREIDSTQSRFVKGDATIGHDGGVTGDNIGIVPAIVLLNGF